MVSAELLNSYYLMFIASRCDRILAFALDKHGAVGSDNRNALSVRTRDGTFADPVSYTHLTLPTTPYV